MITAKGTKLFFAMCIGCPVSEQIRDEFCNKLKEQEAIEKGNKCYLDEVRKESTRVLDKDDPDGFGEDVYSCNNCGAYAPGIELIIHHKGCKLGEAKRWEEFYEKANAEEEEYDKQGMDDYYEEGGD